LGLNSAAARPRIDLIFGMLKLKGRLRSRAKFRVDRAVGGRVRVRRKATVKCEKVGLFETLLRPTRGRYRQTEKYIIHESLELSGESKILKIGRREVGETRYLSKLVENHPLIHHRISACAFSVKAPYRSLGEKGHKLIQCVHALVS
jgi:hypothetical protein